MKTILITGATGFLGSHLLKALSNNDNYIILVLKRSFSNTTRINNCLKSKNVKTYDIDLIDLEKVFEENKIDAIIHCATNYGRNKTINISSILDSNLMFPINILDLCVKYKVNLFINTDSYFNKVNLSYPYLLHYALSKKSLLLWLKYFSKKIKIINIVLEHIYGEEDNKNKFVFQMIDKIAIKQENYIDLTPGEQYRDFIYVDDVVDAYQKLLEYGFENNFGFASFDLGTGIKTQLKEFVKAIKNITKSQTTLNFGALPYRDEEIMLSVANITKLKEIGWTPKYNYIEGLRKTIDIERQKYESQDAVNSNSNI